MSKTKLPGALWAVAALGFVLPACNHARVEAQPQCIDCDSTPPRNVDTAALRRDFGNAVVAYRAARRAGTLADRCAQISKGFEAVWTEHGSSMALFNAASVLDECGRDEQAAAMYRRVLKVAPKHDLARNNLGVMAWREGDRTAAVRHFETAVDGNAATAAARNNLAVALRGSYVRAKRPEAFRAAEEHLQSVLAVDSDNRLAYENLARLYYDRGRGGDRSYLLLADLVVAQAARVLDRKRVASADLHNLHGLVLLAKQDDQIGALQAFKKATELDPKHADAHLNLAMISIRFRDYRQAEKSVEAALRDPQRARDIDAYLALGVAKRGLRQYRDAQAAFRKALEISPQDPRALYNLGVLFHDHIAGGQDDFDEAPYKKAISLFDRFARAAATKAPYREPVADAKLRVRNIERFLRDVADIEKLERKAAAAARAEAQRQAKEREQLLELERKLKGEQT